jgi:hypothetical protein
VDLFLKLQWSVFNGLSGLNLHWLFASLHPQPINWWECELLGGMENKQKLVAFTNLPRWFERGQRTEMDTSFTTWIAQAMLAIATKATRQTQVSKVSSSLLQCRMVH